MAPAGRPALEASTNGELIALCRRHDGRDERPYTELLRRHRQLVWSVVRRYFRNREDIADLVQEVFFRAFRSLDGYRGADDRQFRGWLVRIAANICKNELRRRARRPQLVDEEPSMSSLEAPQPAAVVSDEQRALLARAMATLPDVQREILELADLRQLPYPRIAEQLGLSLSAVKMRTVRARAGLAVTYRDLETKGKTT